MTTIETFSVQKMHFKMLSGKCRPFCSGFNVLTILDLSVVREKLDQKEMELKSKGIITSVASQQQIAAGNTNTAVLGAGRIAQLDAELKQAKVSGLINSLTPGRFKVNFRWVIFKLILVVNGWGISCETALIWVWLDHTYDKSTLVQVMAWCRQATSHYLNQCWPRSLPPYGVTRPHWPLGDLTTVSN